MEQKILSISQITNTIKSVLEHRFGNIDIVGEISNFKPHSSGHKYFSLKDENAVISAVMWKSVSLNFQPSDGMKVIVNGSITVYPPRGNYQISISSIRPEGQGDLFLAFEALKKKLSEKGWFDALNKSSLPRLPLKIGVSTSKTGAAVRDIFSTIQRRFPSAEIYFRPTVVQGEEASPDIVRAIEELNNTNCEVIIIGRGGGSLEDLWAFNTEEVANAIYNSKKPIISAVGHETDFTISDFVADFRAATPTAAAELATPILQAELVRNMIIYEKRSFTLLQNSIKQLKEKLRFTLKDNIQRNLINQINYYNQSLDDKASKMQSILNYKISDSRNKLGYFEKSLKANHPFAPLKKGYAAIKKEGKYLTNSDEINPKDIIEIERENQTINAKVSKIFPRSLFKEM